MYLYIIQEKFKVFFFFLHRKPARSQICLNFHLHRGLGREPQNWGRDDFLEHPNVKGERLAYAMNEKRSGFLPEVTTQT